MRNRRAAFAVASGLFLLLPTLRAQTRQTPRIPPQTAETLELTFMKPGETTLDVRPPTQFVNAILRPGDTRVVNQKITHVDLEPSDKGLQVTWSGSKIVFKAPPETVGREYTLTVTYECTREEAQRRGLRTVWVNVAAETRTASLPVAILLPKLPDTVLTPGKTVELPLPENVAPMKATLVAGGIVSVDDTHPRRLLFTGKKVGKTKVKLRYSLEGKEHVAEGQVEVLAREIRIPIAATVDTAMSVTPAEVEKRSQLEGKFLSMADAGDPKLCKVRLEGGAIAILGLEDGKTSVVAIYGVKNKERIKVEIEITVKKQPRSG